ncbi:MAG: hypothetical protein ACR2FS_07725 [Phormidesmis sp.]
MTQPYSTPEELAAASLTRAMTLFSFTAACRLTNTDPAQVIAEISGALATIRQHNQPIAKQREIGLAYQRVAKDVRLQILRGQLAEQHEEASR